MMSMQCKNAALRGCLIDVPPPVNFFEIEAVGHPMTWRRALAMILTILLRSID
ncbi:MAG: hypothetical protein WCF57_20130 [Pyrinomonadaceae bacterium]